MLWVVGLAYLLALPFAVLPWHVLDNIFAWFSMESLPDAPMVIYLFKSMCALAGVMGVFLCVVGA